MERRRQDPADRWPVDAKGMVVLTIREIDYSDEEMREMLLAEFLCAAWPSSTAQDQ
jgi:hypothetical protein